MASQLNKVVVAGGGVLGTQIGLMCAYAGKDVTFWLRSEGSIERTKPKIERYSSLMLQDLLGAKAYIGNPMGGYLYPKGLIREWKGITAEAIDALADESIDDFVEMRRRQAHDERRRRPQWRSTQLRP